MIRTLDRDRILIAQPDNFNSLGERTLKALKLQDLPTSIVVNPLKIPPPKCSLFSGSHRSSQQGDSEGEYRTELLQISH